MLNIIYTISPNLVNELKTVASLRQSILLYPLSPKMETQLQFSTSVERIENALLLSGKSIQRNEIISALMNYVAFRTYTNRKRNSATEIEKLIYGYKEANDYLKHDWLVSSNIIDIKDIISVHNILSSGTLKIQERKVAEVLEYLQTAAENPVVQAAIAKLAFKALSPFSEGNEISSTFYSYLFLYKAGLDFKGMLDLEKGWNIDINDFHKQYGKAIATTNVTSWLEYFTKSLAQSLQASYNEILRLTKSSELHIIQSHKIGELNERQIAILSIFDEPQAIVTNRTVQKLFKVSQITASRDLAKLASIGLLFVHGKGRSVRYTKI